MMIGKMRSVLFLFAMSAWFALVAQQPAAKRVYPVEFSPALGINSATLARQRLSEPFSEGTAHPAGAATCAALLPSAKKFNGEQTAKITLADCLIVDELSRATTAKASFVADLKWDERVLPLLPAELAINISKESLRAAHGKTWIMVEPAASATVPKPDQILIKGKGFTESLILWGRGDFNQDGRQDLLVQTLDTLTEGSYRNTRLFILTRKLPNARLSVLRELL